MPQSVMSTPMVLVTTSDEAADVNATSTAPCNTATTSRLPRLVL